MMTFLDSLRKSRSFLWKGSLLLIYKAKAIIACLKVIDIIMNTKTISYSMEKKSGSMVEK